jgi:hypothetical protein
MRLGTTQTPNNYSPAPRQGIYVLHMITICMSTIALFLDQDLVITSCSTIRSRKSSKNPRTSAAKLTCKEITAGLVQSLAAHAQIELYIQAPLQQIDIIVLILLAS